LFTDNTKYIIILKEIVKKIAFILLPITVNVHTSNSSLTMSSIPF